MFTLRTFTDFAFFFASLLLFSFLDFVSVVDCSLSLGAPSAALGSMFTTFGTFASAASSLADTREMSADVLLILEVAVAIIDM